MSRVKSEAPICGRVFGLGILLTDLSDVPAVGCISWRPSSECLFTTMNNYTLGACCQSGNDLLWPRPDCSRNARPIRAIGAGGNQPCLKSIPCSARQLFVAGTGGLLVNSIPPAVNGADSS